MGSQSPMTAEDGAVMLFNCHLSVRFLIEATLAQMT